MRCRIDSVDPAAGRRTVAGCPAAFRRFEPIDHESGSFQLQFGLLGFADWIAGGTAAAAVEFASAGAVAAIVAVVDAAVVAGGHVAVGTVELPERNSGLVRVLWEEMETWWLLYLLLQELLLLLLLLSSLDLLLQLQLLLFIRRHHRLDIEYG